MRSYLKPEEIHSFMEEKCKLAFDYGDWFADQEYASFIRMNLATSKENIEYAINRLVEELSELK